MLIEVEGVNSPAVTHAFVVGVSHYPFLDGPLMTDRGEQLGMANLNSAARSASEVAAWLLTEYHFPEAPLKDVRLLLSPVEGEQVNADVAARIGGQPAAATRDAVRKEFTAFKNACAENTANRAFVFLTGHGIQLSSRGAILLLEDFATDEDGDLLFGAMDVMGCHGSMWATGQADHQVWFSDACRQRPEIVKRFETLSGAWAPGDVTGGDVAATPILLSSSARENAFADPTALTLFTQALLWGLREAGVVGPDSVCEQWHVSTQQLVKILKDRVGALARAGGADQSIDPTGKAVDVAVQQFAEPPPVQVELTVIPANLDPLPVAELLRNATDAVPVEPGWPLKVRTSAGLYLLEATHAGPTPRNTTKILDVQPPVFHGEVRFP